MPVCAVSIGRVRLLYSELQRLVEANALPIASWQRIGLWYTRLAAFFTKLKAFLVNGVSGFTGFHATKSIAPGTPLS